MVECHWLSQYVGLFTVLHITFDFKSNFCFHLILESGFSNAQEDGNDEDKSHSGSMNIGRQDTTLGQKDTSGDSSNQPFGADLSRLPPIQQSLYRRIQQQQRVNTVVQTPDGLTNGT